MAFQAFRTESKELFFMSRTTNIRKLAVMALLVAVSVVLIYAVHFPLIPAAAFLEYDPADIPILIGALAYGPLAGVCLTVVASLIQGVTVSAGSGLYGIVMHIIATSTLVLVAGSVYRFRRTRSGGMLGLLLGTLAMGFIMMPANHIITPYFTGWPTEAVDALLLPGILPFNLLKAGLNSVVTFLLYKTVSLLHRPRRGLEQARAPEGLTRKPALQKPPPERCSSGRFFLSLTSSGPPQTD